MDNNQIYGISKDNKESIYEHNFNRGLYSDKHKKNNNKSLNNSSLKEDKCPITVYLHDINKSNANKSRLQSANTIRNQSSISESANITNSILLRLRDEDSVYGFDRSVIYNNNGNFEGERDSRISN